MGANNKCDICGQSEVLPFKCRYCGGTFCGDHRLPEKHDCVYDFKQKYNEQPNTSIKTPSNIPSYTRNTERTNISTMANQNYGRNRPKHKFIRLKVPRILKNKLVIGLIILCLIGFIGYYDYSTNHSNLYNSYIVPLGNACASGISGFIDPYYNTPYYKYALKTTEYGSGQTTEVYESYPNGSYCFITNYKNATNPTYKELANFLKNDQTEQQTYIDNEYVCANFATRLHDNAEIKNIKAYIVTVELWNSPGHMINGFNTTDRGWVYIDDTGLTNYYKLKGCPATDTYVNLIPGENYILRDIVSGASGNWYHDDMGIINGYHVWDSVENYSIWNSLQYR